MPSFETFEAYARRVESEMPKSTSLEKQKRPTKKRCPGCDTENELGARMCCSCGYEFSGGQVRLKSCLQCGALNYTAATSCQSCGASFRANFVLTLDEALRTGAIVRGMDLTEEEVRLGENMAGPFREKILASGDEQLVRILRVLPEESFARLKGILEHP